MTPYYQDEAVTLYLGDCREILPQLEPVDHVITDPPYSRDVYIRASAIYAKPGSGTPKRMGLSEQKRRGGALQKMANGDIGAMDVALMNIVARLTSSRVRRWWIVFSDAESTHLWKEAAERAGLRFVRTGAWFKPNSMPQMSGDRPAVGYEPCTICHSPGPMRWNGGGKRGVWEHLTCGGSERPDHPCPKPESLMRELVTDFTDDGEVIMDPFAGSGTTLVAAKRLGRKAIGIEINEQYAEVAARRLSQGALDLFGGSELVVPEARPPATERA